MKINRDSDFFKNTVSAKGQLEESKRVSFYLKDDSAIRVLFVGNSITRHGILESIGWFGDYGMAASCKENDYVHRTVHGFEKIYGNVSFCIVSASDWERNFNNDEILFEKDFASAKLFDPDIVIIRLGENVNNGLLSKYCFKTHFACLVKYFSENAEKTIVTSLFWEYEPIDEQIKSFCENTPGVIYVPINQFGRRDDYKAIGEYEHNGVAQHPNDRGMKEIADALLKALGNFCDEN